MSEQGNYNVLVEVKKTTIWLRKKDAEKPIDGRIKNQGVTYDRKQDNID